MAWRFKASKYKNAAPIVPKPEACIRDITVGSYQSYGNNIAASAAFMAFNWDHAGSSLAVLPLDDCGRKSKTMPLLHAHTDTVTDLQFSPFHDGLLVTGSQDCLLKVWHIPEKGLETTITEPECTFSHKQRRVETVGFHPTADCLIHSTSVGRLCLWDLTSQKEAFSNNEHPEVIQSASWRLDGTLMATTCKDKMVRILDPRSTQLISMSANSHQSIKDSRVIWLADNNKILTTGFDSNRLRQVYIRDIRKLNSPEKSLELDCTTGILMPLYDPDTNMLFLAGKGDSTIIYMEVSDNQPHLIEGLRHTGEQTKGASLVPKRALRIMEGEVNRVLQLTSNSVIPIMYQVPRKSYRDYHSDLYPDTNGYRTELQANDWLEGKNLPVAKMSLDPNKRELGDKPITIHRGNLKEVSMNYFNKIKERKITDQPKKNERFISAEPVVAKPINKTDHHFNDNKNELFENEKFLKGSKKYDENIPIANIKPFDIECNVQLHNDNVETQSHTKYKSALGSQSSSNNSSLEESSPSESHSHGNGNGNYNANGNDNDNHKEPPTPLPRSSRQSSLKDDQEEIAIVRPVARPRTTATYKPRLGPKPFTSSSASDMSFDQVFTVPQAPGNGNAHNKPDVIPYCDNGNGVENKKEAQPDTLEEKHDNGTTKDINEEDEEVTYRVSTLEKRKETNIETNNKIFESMQMGDSDLSRGNSLDSVDADLKRMSAHRSSIAERRRMYESSAKGSEEKPPQSPIVSRSESMKQQPEATATVTADPFRRPQLPKKSEDKVKEPSPAMTKRTSTVFGKVSKYRHLKCTPAHKSTHIENLRNISRQIPGECNGFHANHKRVAIPLSGQGGKIAVYELSKAGRQPDGVIPSLVNGSNIMDFQWDPFDADRLAVAMDDGVVKLWRIPADGLKEPTNDAEQELSAHVDKIYFIRFHPTANNILVTASYDLTIKFWNLDTSQNVITLKGHTDQIFDFAWSPCGRYCATVCRDGKIRIFDPRCLDTPIREGPGPVGTRGARITFAIDGQYIVCTGFDKVSERQISVYKVSNLSAPLNTVGLDVSPAILMIYYDEDSSTLFLTGKGDSTIYAFEITDESPFICPLSHHRSMSLHQGLSFISKNHCDVANVEFAKAYRLTNTTVEPLSFTVPRIKSELFQDDLFPLTRITWSPTLSAKEWFDGVNRVVQKVNLQPEGMESLSSLNSQSTPQHTSNTPAKVNPSAQAVNPTWVPSNGSSSESQKEKEKEIQKSISERMEFTTKLEQDDMEGVDEQEWQE